MRFAVLLAGALALSAQESVKNAVVEGAVVNSVTGAPVEGVKVELANIGGKHHYNLVTDAKGLFFYDNVAPGDYIPVVHKDGFVLSKSGITGGGAPFHVEAGSEPVRPRLELIPPGTLKGRVFAPDGKPAAGVEVALAPYNRTRTEKTAEDGSFVFANVEAGLHSLVAGGEQTRTYYPAAVDPAVGEEIVMAPGADQGGYEIRLQTATVHRVRGIVLDANGKGKAKALVQLTRPERRGEPIGFSSNGVTSFSLENRRRGVAPALEKPVIADERGEFEFPAVREGDWLLCFDTRTPGVPISVHKDVDDVRLQVSMPFELPGRVITGDGNAPPAAVVVARLAPDTAIPSMSISGKEGALRFQNLTPGPYRVRASALANYYISSVTVGEADATEQTVALGPASGPIQIVIKPGAAINGNVEKGEGATVLVIPQSLAQGAQGKLQVAGPDGKFQFAGLAPDDYYVVAVRDFDGPSILNIERFREIVRDAAAVHLDEGGAASIRLK